MEKLRNVLLIDDDPTTSFLQKKVIQSFGFSEKVEIANDGEEALQLLGKYIHAENEDMIPQLIFVDIDMPFMDGFQFLEAYQKLYFREKDSVVVAVLTSSISPQDMKRAKEFSVEAYLVKPLTKEKMIELMQEHFGRHSTNI